MQQPLNPNRRKDQGYGCYLAPDGKASLARIGAVSLLQSAWVLQYEHMYKCFAARCVDILQGHVSTSERFCKGPRWAGKNGLTA
ncbi:MAG: hypothetical protein M5Z89_00625 [Olivibacter sp.]|nr:hypothetical protein [Olivibacter sp. UJ_SKK_5.1]